MSEATEKLRIDKWLWHARFFKTRGLAAKVAGAGHVRVNGERIAKASATVRTGDVLTFPQARHVRVVRILALGLRRGPAAEAQGLYDDLDPPKPPEPKSGPITERGQGRPTKRDRRAIDAVRGSLLE